ncbi:hypothetical protein M427DRAFT_412001 [Gonapodya prolifera JEL478]|uniref:Cyclin N-terminal domain-containing protein n=1 Tax=Gonapodya prolifera (strain JEL478) TaxID=1344416 RepID=A0A139A6N5_GONPJ|nr:hypothetical protein M427DRAFT_412001 [Gonapodya prolifera JEL478]|eukprot:KXS12003.1 hypothetical protein M427DRAFT_412001 [Gonapodya prolifera JEL478]
MAMPGWMGSVIQYVRPSELKKELNEQFRLTHPKVERTLTLSQIRNLKKKIVDVAEEMDLDPSCVAQSFVYFEKLIIKDKVNKANRRLVAAACLLLALKASADEFLLAANENDLSPAGKGAPKETRETKYARLLETVDKHLDVSPKEVVTHEFSVFAALEFSLYVPAREMVPHLVRVGHLLKMKRIEEYADAEGKWWRAGE